MTTHQNSVPIRHNVTKQIFEEEILPQGEPVILKDLVSDWPIVHAALQSRNDLGSYLKQHDSGVAIETFVGQPEMKGRYFYNQEMTGFNYEKGETTLSHIVDQLMLTAEGPPPLMIYAGSAPSGATMPDFSRQNPMPLLNSEIEPRLWLGNTSRVAAHYDNSRNIACCIAGTRRFTLFAPEQIANLYVGPLEFTMAGPPASMVDFDNPDYDRYPKFREAEEAALIAELEPGDAIYIPSLWWHHVEASGPLNMLANYWWMPKCAGPALEAVLLALMTIRDQPEPEKQAWKAFFEHYVFGSEADQVADHLPKKWQTVTGPKTPGRDAFILSYIIKQIGK